MNDQGKWWLHSPEKTNERHWALNKHYEYLTLSLETLVLKSFRITRTQINPDRFAWERLLVLFIFKYFSSSFFLHRFQLFVFLGLSTVVVDWEPTFCLYRLWHIDIPIFIVSEVWKWTKGEFSFESQTFFLN